jgi:hypothetical protein
MQYLSYKYAFKIFLYLTLSVFVTACADDDPNMLKFELVIQNHRFSPKESVTPSNT